MKETSGSVFIKRNNERRTKETGMNRHLYIYSMRMLRLINLSVCI